MKQYRFYVYIMANHYKGTLYIGVTNDLVRRVYEHKSKLYPNSFTARYNCDKLVYYEDFQYINDALNREKQLKSGTRERKIQFIASINKDWVDLSAQLMFWIR